MQKPARKPRPAVDRPSVLVLHEKHATFYYYIPDEETLFKAALDIVRGRNKPESYHRYYKPEEPKGPPITKAEVDALPEAVKKEGQKQLDAYNSNMKWYQQEKESWETLQKALAENDGRLAWQFLRDRSDGEYERVSIERVLQIGDYSK